MTKSTHNDLSKSSAQTRSKSSPFALKYPMCFISILLHFNGVKNTINDTLNFDYGEVSHEL